MTDTLLEQIKADRENGTPGPWVINETYSGYSYVGPRKRDIPSLSFVVAKFETHELLTLDARRRNRADARRCKNIPAMEERIFEITEARARDAETIKAARALADQLEDLAKYSDWFPQSAYDALAAFRATQEKNDG